jgi:triacylglycerol lipase
MNNNQFGGVARRNFLTHAALVGGLGFLAPWATPIIEKAYATGPNQDSPTGFDPKFALDVPLPLSLAAYSVADRQPAIIPPGYVSTALIKVDIGVAATTAQKHPEVTEKSLKVNIFGLMGRNAATRTAFAAFRGTDKFDEILLDLYAIPETYKPAREFGYVHAGLQIIYQLIRGSIAANLAATCVGCDKLLITGHSLGAALGVLAAPDIVVNMSPNIQPTLITFGGPKTGLHDFADAFNKVIKCCFRVVNYLDVVPFLPPLLYTHVGTAIDVDSGGSSDPLSRHSLYAYKTGLETHP